MGEERREEEEEKRGREGGGRSSLTRSFVSFEKEEKKKAAKEKSPERRASGKRKRKKKKVSWPLKEKERKGRKEGGEFEREPAVFPWPGRPLSPTLHHPSSKVSKYVRYSST